MYSYYMTSPASDVDINLSQTVENASTTLSPSPIDAAIQTTNDVVTPLFVDKSTSTSDSTSESISNSNSTSTSTQKSSPSTPSSASFISPSVKKKMGLIASKAVLPYNVAVILTFYSPIVLSILIVSISFIFQNFNGLGFLFWIIVFSFLRSILLRMVGFKPSVGGETICDTIQYSEYGNSTFSMFFIAFTCVYLLAPMIINNDINYFILAGGLFYYLLDVGIRYSSGCLVNSLLDVFFNTILGIASGMFSIGSMYLSNNQQYLFFNQVSSTKDVCTMPSKQTFKCRVFKNGELIGSIPSPSTK